MKEVSDDMDPDHSDASPYHSDNDSAVMMSGNSPFISKTARYNFLSRSVRMGSKHNVRASILASSLSEVNLELHSSRASHSTGPPSLVLHSSSGVSSGSGSSDTASGSDDKCESPTPSATASHGSSNTVKRRPEAGGGRVTRPRHLKQKKDAGYKAGANGILKPPAVAAVCSKCDGEDSSEPVYQGILEVAGKPGITETSIPEINNLKADVTRLTAELTKA